MKVRVEQLGSVTYRVTVEIPAVEVDKVLNKLYQKLKRYAKIKGFRPGKAPRFILEKHYGSRLESEAIENLISDYYPKAIEEVKLEPLARPLFDFGPLKLSTDFIFKVTFDVNPKFELDSTCYKSLKLQEPDLKVGEEEIVSQLELLRDRQAILVPLEENRSAQAGDIIILDYKSFIDDKPVENGIAKNLTIELGKGEAQQQIEMALFNSKPGDQIETKVDYDDNSPNEWARGKQVRFELNVKALKKKILPELDDDFARNVSAEFETLQDLKNRIHRDLSNLCEQQKNEALRNQILEYLQGIGQFEIPASLVSLKIKNMIDDFKMRLRHNGVDLNQVNIDNVKLNEGFKTEAEKKVRAGIILSRIAELEKIKIDEDDLNNEISRLASRMGKPIDFIRDLYIKNNKMLDLSTRLLEEKTLQVIKANAIIEIVTSKSSS